jgi:DNA-dependent metalloprotease WSS1
MPLGFQRLNERTQRPNANISFIKPLPDRPDTHVAQDFLDRIAAQCYPIMKEHYISVVTLEEYPPNPEFLGRNFNAGEVIQLVLKDKSGRWLSFNLVQKVMMHELAHCKQMNHSRLFWKVRDGYAKQMEELWAKKYVGEGMWGRGKELRSGEFVHDRMPDDAQIPEHLCGGTYRRRGWKRKRGQASEETQKLSYAERQQKRIARKFGKHGEGAVLGEDELVRGALAKGSTKPRVANSNRGRELRANAALARFEALKEQTIPEKAPELDEDAGSETELDYGWASDNDADSNLTGRSKVNGVDIKDENDRQLIKVCGDEGEDEGGQNEMNELRVLSGKPSNFPNRAREAEEAPETKHNSWRDGDDSETESPSQHQTSAADSDSAVSHSNTLGTTPGEHATTEMTACPICSLENEASSPTCIACSHVLKISLVKNHWRCKSDACKGSKYINAGDTGRCGLCGGQKPAATGGDGGRPLGVTSAATLRWE